VFFCIARNLQRLIAQSNSVPTCAKLFTYKQSGSFIRIYESLFTTKHTFYFITHLLVLGSILGTIDITAFAYSMPVFACCMPYHSDWWHCNKASLFFASFWLTQNKFHHFRPVASPLKVCALERVVDKKKISYFTPSSSSVPPNVLSENTWVFHRFQ